MYERMLDKLVTPTMAEMTGYCGKAGELFTTLNDWLTQTYGTEQTIAFPYGNRYGWGVAHRKKGKLLCYVFAEKNAFAVMVRLNNAQWAAVYANAGELMRERIDHKYPCNEGGYVHYRVTAPEQFGDIQAALTLRCS